ncbi:MAG: DUF2953 domain-containing protein [Methanoculleus sp.]
MPATLLIIILIVVVALILALLLALYVVPVSISMVADCNRECARATATVAWGIVGARVRATDEAQTIEVLLIGRPIVIRDLKEMAGTEPAKKREEEKEERAPLPVGEYLDAFRDLRPHIQEILAAVYRSLFLETLRGDVVLGLDSPASTGVIYGYCTAIRYILWPVEAIDFVVTPDFNHKIFEGMFTLRLQVRRSLLITIPVVKALLKRPVRQRLRQVSGRGVPGV